MRAAGTLTDPAAPDKIKMPRWDILILSWLGQLDSLARHCVPAMRNP